MRRSLFFTSMAALAVIVLGTSAMAALAVIVLGTSAQAATMATDWDRDMAMAPAGEVGTVTIVAGFSTDLPTKGITDTTDLLLIGEVMTQLTSEPDISVVTNDIAWAVQHLFQPANGSEIDMLPGVLAMDDVIASDSDMTDTQIRIEVIQAAVGDKMDLGDISTMAELDLIRGGISRTLL